MKELTKEEVKIVAGGLWPAFVAGYFVGSIAKKLYNKYAWCKQKGIG